jgi:hypothetical protein
MNCPPLPLPSKEMGKRVFQFGRRYYLSLSLKEASHAVKISLEAEKWLYAD